MAFSMHSHSGQFCPGHAKDQLEEIVQRAILLRMRAFAFTEHMPRNQAKDLYPEELGEGGTPEEVISAMFTRHRAYIKEAVRLREKYKDVIKIIIGFEAEWIRPAYGELVEEFMKDSEIDYFIGSVHHMHEIPIDYDRAMYEQAREVAGGTDESLFADYFDAHFEMLKRLKPRVVGHFDLIRLLSDAPDLDMRTMPRVWQKITRNLDLIQEQGGLVEINSSALRKGLKEPYPSRSICEYFLGIGGKFTLSDDSHGLPQVGLNFSRAISFLDSVGVKSLSYLERQDLASANGERGSVVVKNVPLNEVQVLHHPST